MVLKNHIAHRFLTDETFTFEMLKVHMPSQLERFLDGGKLTDIESSQLWTLNNTICAISQEAFYITDTIVEKVDMLKVKLKDNGHYDWSVFSHLRDQKKTFIYSDNSLIRISISAGYLCFCWIDAKPSKEHRGQDEVDFHLFNLKQSTQEFSSNWVADSYVGKLEEKIYKLLCFFYLADNELIIVSPGQKYGTRKEGKLINTFKDIPITIVNSNWNITSIRTEGFGVRGHFAIRWSGEGRSIPKMVFIEPFKKNGYMRRAKNVDHI